LSTGWIELTTDGKRMWVEVESKGKHFFTLLSCFSPRNLLIISFELCNTNPLYQVLGLVHRVQNIFHKIQELLAYTGTTSCKIRLPRRFLRFVLMARSTFTPRSWLK